MHRPQCGLQLNVQQSRNASVGAHTVGDGNVNSVKINNLYFCYLKRR
jgi:hypothetical protein